MRSAVAKILLAASCTLLAWAPRTSRACAVCTSAAEDSNRLAFILTTALLSFLPLLIVGGFVWDRLVRPAEEANLTATFGLAYEQYRDKVKCWRPRLKPYKAKVT